MASINTNVKALAAQSSINNVDRTMQTSMQRLSTGLRINNAKDDAAGLAISNRMTSDIRGFAVAIRNANDGLSMAQTADGALGLVTDMLQRMRELAVQAGNGSLNADNRIASQLEVDQLKQQIDNIATQTNFNSINLLDGSAGNIKLQTNVRANQQMVMSIDSAQTKDIGLGSRASLTSTGFAGTEIAETQKVTFSGAVTVADTTTFLGVAVTGGASTLSTLATRAVANKATILAGTAAIAAGVTDITADSSDANSVLLTFGGANGKGNVALLTNATNNATVSTFVEVTKGSAASTISKPMAAGDLIINGVQIGATKATDDLLSVVNKESSAIAKVAAINAVSSQTGVVASIGNTQAYGSSMQVANTTGALTINGVNTSTITTVSDAGLDRAAVVTAINNISAQTGVRAIDTGDINKGVNLIADDGRNISLVYGGSLNSKSTGLGSSSVSFKGSDIGGGSNIGLVAGVGLVGSNTFKVNGVTVTATALGVSLSANEIVTGITNAGISGLSASATSGVITLTSTSGNIYIESGTNLSAANLKQIFGPNYTSSSQPSQVYTGTYQLGSQNGSEIQVSSTSNGDIRTAGLTRGTYTANTSYVTSTDRAVATAAASSSTTGTLEAGTLRINGTSIVAASTADDTASAAYVAGTSTVITSSAKSASAIAIASAINKASAISGVTASASSNVITGVTFDNSSAPTSANLYVNGVTVSLSTLAANYTRADVASLINAQTGQTGVVVTDNGRGLSLVASDGRNISLALSGTTKASAVGILGTAFGMSDDVTAVTNTTAAASATTYSRVTLSSDKSFTVEGGSDGNANFALLGFKTGTFGGVDNGVKVSKIDITSQAGAQVAITALDAALKSVSLNQARLGAFQNRLDQVVSNLTTMNQNMSASRSRVQDADYATETTNLAKSQIISQAATAMLAQANQSSQSVLALLK